MGSLFQYALHHNLSLVLKVYFSQSSHLLPLDGRLFSMYPYASIMKTPSRWQRLLLRLWAIWERHHYPNEEDVGAWGERWATRYLRLCGCRILAQNIHPIRHGELDIIARRYGVTLFVEVKTRKHEIYGRPMEAIDHRKRVLIRRCTTAWLSKHHLLGKPHFYRFDAMEVVGQPHKGVPILRWIQQIDMSETPYPNV